MTIRTYQPGDDAALVGIYNEAAAGLPKFKPATLDEMRRRSRGPDFDPALRFFALADGRPVGYATAHANGRVSFPWCRAGHEALAEPLFQAALDALRSRRVRRAFAAYRADWPAQAEFFQAHGFQRAREMVNFATTLIDLPTAAVRSGSAVTPLKPEEVPAVYALGPQVVRCRDAAELTEYLFHNPLFPASAVFAIRSRTTRAPLAVGVLVEDASYANPLQLDSGMPCFRLGAFATEGLQVKRVNGLFSFLAAPGNEVAPMGLDLLNHAVRRAERSGVETLAAQVPSDAAHLLRFYQQHFRRQGSFPVFERTLP
jgi:hypothetical protein